MPPRTPIALRDWLTGVVFLGVFLASAASSGSPYRDLVLSYNPVAYWRLGELSGATAADEAEAYNGAYQNGFMLGVSGAIDDDADTSADLAGGADDRVQIAGLGVSGTGITLLAWFNADAFGDDRIISKATGENIPDHYWSLGTPNNSSLRVRLMLNGATVQHTFSTSAFSTGQWYFVAVTYDGSTVRAYVNGGQIGSASATGTLSTNTSVATAIGNQPSGAGDRAFDGRIDEVAVFDEALTATEISSLYAIATGGGLFAHWKLDETIGTTADDATSNGNDGTLNGNPVWTTSGQREGALDFETSDGVDRIDAGYFDVTGANLTLAAWIRQETPLNDARIIIKSSSNSGADQSWGLTADQNGELDLRVKAGGTWDRVQAPGVISAGMWHHVAGTYDGATMRLYLDGELVATKTHASGGAIASAPSRAVTIGDSPIGARPFDGLIDDVRVYDITLTDVEVAALYGVLGHWTFDEGSGSTIADFSPNASDASFNTGTPMWVSGVRGGALEFDGSNDADTDASFDPPSTGTVAFWFRSEGLPSGTEPLFGTESNWEVRIEPTGEVYFDLGGEANGTDFHTAAGVAGSGRWRHLAAMFNADTDTFSLYLDGQLVGSGSISLAQQPSAALSIGARTGSTERFAGALDDLRIYHYELSEAEVAKLYGLVGHWKLNETSGTTASDSSAVDNDGVYTNNPTLGESGPYPGSGQDGVLFDGEGDIVVAPNHGAYEVKDGVSLATWVRIDAAGAHGLIVHSNVASPYALLVGNDNEVIFAANWGSVEGGIGNIFFLSDTKLTVGKWRHVVATYDGSTVRFYIDGQLDANSLHSSVTIGHSDDPMQLGDDGVAGFALEGAMFDARVYNRAIRHEEVAELYGLVGHWKLDESSGTAAADSSGSGLHGTYVNSPLLGESSKSRKLGTAVKFNGFDQHVALPAMQFDYSAGTTMAAWIKPTAVPSDWYAILGMAVGYTVDATWYGWSDSYGILCFLYDPTDGASYRSLSDGADPTLNTWHHCIVSIDNAGGATIYRNGTPVASGYTSLPTSGSRSQNYIGFSVENDPFVGWLDDVRLYNRAISLEEAEKLYKGSLPSGLRIIKWVEVR